MRTFNRILLGTLLMLLVALASAHGNHGDEAPIGNSDATEISGRTVALLVENKKLAESWQKNQVKEVKSHQTPSGLIWIVRYENPNEIDKAKRSLYIYLDEFGGYIGGNHSGKF